MRTTLDLPDQVLTKAKVMAAEEGVSLKTIVTRALQNEIAKPTDPDRPAKVKRALEEIQKLPSTSKPMWNCPPETSFWEYDEEYLASNH